MTEQEEIFLKNLKYKLKYYGIQRAIDDPDRPGKKKMVPVTVKDALTRANNKFVMTTYNDGTTELVDTGIERFLYQCSPYLFIDKYCFIELPGYGRMPASKLYYYQKMILKDYNEVIKKYVFTKTRQCLTKDNFVMTDRGYISIKDVKIGDKIQTIKNNELYWTDVLDFIPQGEKETFSVGIKLFGCIYGTADHKVLTDKGWKEIQELKTGEDKVLTEVGYRTVEFILNNGKQEVYDITTGTHDFLANGVVVHNCGMSTLSSLLFFWKAVCFRGQEAIIISKDGDSAKDVLKKIKDNLDCIPQWFGLEVITNNVRSVSFTNKSTITSYARSPTSGRGKSPTYVLLDENAFYQTEALVEGIVSSVQASLTRTGGILFIVSTPNGTLGQGRYYYNQVQSLKAVGGQTDIAKLTDISWWEILDIDGITPYKGYNAKVQSYIDRDYAHHPEVKLEAEKFFEPIVKDWKHNDWLRYQMETLGNVLFRQEILKDFVVMGNTVFTTEVLERVMQKCQEPISKNICDTKKIDGFWIFKKPNIEHKYIIGCDIAKGSGTDSSAIQVVDMNTYEQVAEYLGKCTTIDLAHYIDTIAKYYNYGYVVVESNSIGEAVFNELYYNLNYANLFKQIKNKNGIDVATGWITSVKSRDLITNNFIQMYNDEEMWKYYTPRSTRLLEQMKTWVWKNNRPDHLPNDHDDLILSMAITLFNVAEGIKKIRKPEDAFFYSENGEAINMLDKENTLTNNYLNNRANTGKELPESVYRNTEKQMYRNAGINPDDEDAASTYKWLIS